MQFCFIAVTPPSPGRRKCAFEGCRQCALEMYVVDFLNGITPLPGLLLHLVFVFESCCWPFFVVYDVMIFARLKADLHRITKKVTRECYLLSSTTHCC